ncbi:MAG: hypothetical protein ACK4VW_09915 [Anaerolineales bacterium]
MFPLVEFPELVEHYAPFFREVFSAEAFIEFKRYISGLIVSENKTVDGINRLCVMESRNQSSLNRWLTQSSFSLEALNQANAAKTKRRVECGRHLADPLWAGVRAHRQVV